MSNEGEKKPEDGGQQDIEKQDVRKMTSEELRVADEKEVKRILETANPQDTVDTNNIWRDEIERRKFEALAIEEERKKNDPANMDAKQLDDALKKIKAGMRSVDKESDEYHQLMGAYTFYYKELARRAHEKQLRQQEDKISARKSRAARAAKKKKQP